MNTNNSNFIFWGTPDVARDTLEMLKQNGFLPSLIVTSPDARSGRKMLLTPPPVKAWAIENNIPYIQPEQLTDLTEFLPIFHSCALPGVPVGTLGDSKSKEIQFDFFLVVAYGKIIPEKILKIPKLGSINVHYSLLPKYRGASPVESAILNGDSQTGVSIQQMVYQMDAGPILAEEKVTIGDDETAPELRKRLIKIGGELLVKMLPDFIQVKIKAITQNETESTYCKKIKKEDGLINLSDDSKENLQNYNKFRAYAYWPRTFFFKNNKRIIITKAKLENNTFLIEKIIPEGGKEMNYKDFNLHHGVD